tara:strand:- start:4325 stop:5443 length:1119 start_codon:yes stop_codon:yes gene_type:complete
MEINLHITATSLEDFRKQIKEAYEQLFGAVVETPNTTTKTEYQELLATKTKEAMETKKKNLKKYTSAIFGWDVDEDDNLHPNWEEQDKITLMKEWYKKLGTYRAVAKRATEAGWKGKKGGNWTSALVKRSITHDLHERVGEFTRPGAETPKKEEKPKKEKKPKKPKKKETAKRSCKRCGVTKTSEWRKTTDPEGPLCNACHMRDYRAAKAKKTTPAKVGKPSEAKRSRKTRDETITANLNRMKGKRKDKTKKTKDKPKPEPIPEVKIEVTEDAFLRWTQQNVAKMILRDKTFLIGTKVIQTWFTTINPSENYDSWLSDNLTTYLTHVKLIFTEFETSHPTIFLHQDAGDNSVLMVNNPRAITAKMLDEVRWV